MSRLLSVRSFLVLLLAVTPLLAGCSKKSSKTITQPGPTPATSILSTVSVGGTLGTFLSGTLPTGVNVAPSVTASDSFVAGANALLTLTVPDTTTAVLLGVTGHTGYFRTAVTSAQRLAAARRSEKYASPGLHVVSARPNAALGTLDLVITVGIMADQSSAPLVFVAEGAHSHSLAATHTFYASHRALGSGQLQFSLSWSSPVDLDLHVAVPVGADSTDVYYGNRDGGGGSLDLDSNAGCGIDNVDNENITWGANVPASGTYKVRVDLWSACDVTANVPWVLTIKKCGQVVQTIHGVALVSEADGGGSFDGKLVATIAFNGCTGPAEAVAPLSATATETPWHRGLQRLGIH